MSGASGASVRGPRGCRLIWESHDDLPMIWLRVAVRGGAAGDPDGVEGFTHHLAMLCRRGAGACDRRALDIALDELGASLDVSVHRDAIVFSGACLRRNLDAIVEILADVLSAPHLDAGEHDKLLRETRMSLDELRDDDASLAARFFNRHCVPGHPYARSVLGTETSLDAIDLGSVRAARRELFVPENLIVGLAGSIDATAAERACARLVRDLPEQSARLLPSLESPKRPRGRRLLVVDKPERSQCQIIIGHLAPHAGHPDIPALTVVETVFGGMFSSRLMQEIRVERGWSYGADCYFHRSRGPHWFAIHLAPPAEVAGDALELALSMFEDLVASGITAEELDFAQHYLAGNLPFRRATAQARLKLRITEQIFGLEENFTEQLPARIAAVTLEEANRVAARWLYPDDTLSVVVASADSMLPSLERIATTDLRVVAHDSY